MEKTNFTSGIVLLSVIPLRKEPKEQSEMVSQLLFGQTFQVTDRNENWLQIRVDADNYTGWISKNMASFLSAAEYEQIRASKTRMVQSLTAELRLSSGERIPILRGSLLPNFCSETQSFSILETQFSFKGELVESVENPRERLVSLAKDYLNTPYLWGGKSPFGIDCSGFTQLLFSLVGVRLPRDASQQIKMGRELAFLEVAEKGDVAFFSNEQGAVVHVGLLLGAKKIIHASGKVRIDSIDGEGIFNENLQKYTHRLCAVKTLL